MIFFYTFAPDIARQWSARGRVQTVVSSIRHSFSAASPR